MVDLNFNYYKLLIIKIKKFHFFRKLKNTIRKYFGISFRLFIIDLIIVVLLGIYISQLLFGSSSLEVLNNLRVEKIALKKEIIKIKIEIMNSHKKYLEIKHNNKNYKKKRD